MEGAPLLDHAGRKPLDAAIPRQEGRAAGHTLGSQVTGLPLEAHTLPQCPTCIPRVPGLGTPLATPPPSLLGAAPLLPHPRGAFSGSGAVLWSTALPLACVWRLLPEPTRVEIILNLSHGEWEPLATCLIMATVVEALTAKSFTTLSHLMHMLSH